jgi:hypothetical protein
VKRKLYDWKIDTFRLISTLKVLVTRKPYKWVLIRTLSIN